METGPVVQVAKRRCNLPFAGGGPASGVGEAAREWGPFAFPGPASKGGPIMLHWQHLPADGCTRHTSRRDTGIGRSHWGPPSHHGRGSMRKILLFVLVFALEGVPAMASLGLTEQSVQADRQQMAGQVKSATLEGYTVHEITAPGGIVVREYVSPVGTVFGLVWEGPTMPNLQQLLGPYYSQFRQAAQSMGHRRGPLYVQVGPLVVESGGHMRAFRGRAYVTSLVPTNLTKDVIR